MDYGQSGRENPTPMVLLALTLLIMWIGARTAWTVIHALITKKLDLAPSGSANPCTEALTKLDNVSESLQAHRNHVAKAFGDPIKRGALSCVWTRDEAIRLADAVTRMATASETMVRLAAAIERQNGKR